MADFKPLDRSQLKEAVGSNHEIIRRFERMFIAAGDTIPANLTIIFRLLEELSISLGTTDSKANQANSSISYLSQIVDVLASAPTPDFARLDTIDTTLRGVDELAGAVDAKANRIADRLAEFIRSTEADPDSLRALINSLASSFSALSRDIEVDPGSIRALANSLASSIQALSRDLEVDPGSLRSEVNRLSDSLINLGRSLEADASRPSFQFPRTFSVDYIDFDQAQAFASQVARVGWNATDDTLDIAHSDGVTQQVGQETYVRFVNNSGVNFANGICIGVNPATNALTTYIANGTLSPLGIVGVTTQSIANGATGRATVFGRVRDIDTTGTPFGEVWTAGDLLYVSTTVTGGFTRVKPTAPNVSIPIGRVVTVNATTGIIFVRPVPEQQLYYGQFAKTTDQLPSAANTAQALTWDSSLIANGVTIGAPASRIVCANAGLYKFSVSLQLTSSSASVKNVWIWFRKNGVDVASSSLITSLDSGTAIRTPSRSLFFSLIAGDYIEVMFASDSTNMTVDNIAATAFAPAAPAATLSVNQEQQ